MEALTLSDKISLDKIFVGQNNAWNKIFYTKPKFRQFCPIFVWLLYWNNGQNFRRTKFSTPSQILTVLSDEFLSEKVCFHCYKNSEQMNTKNDVDIRLIQK